MSREWHELLDRLAMMAWQFEEKYRHRPSHIFLNGPDWQKVKAQGVRMGMFRISDEAEIVQLWGLSVRRADETSVALMMYEGEEDDDDRTEAGEKNATAAERERWLPLLAAVKEEMESNRGWCPVCSGHKTDHMDACPLKLLLEGSAGCV